MTEGMTAGEQISVADIFRRAQAISRENPELSTKGMKERLLTEYRGKPFPPVSTLTIPEQDGRAPEEDWSSGLSLVLRGIQREDWKDIVSGIALSLEQTQRFERERGGPGEGDHWHDRTVGIEEPLSAGLDKWMPRELMSLAEKSAKTSRD